MDYTAHNKIVSFIWSIADDCLRDVSVRGKYRDVILPMFVLRRLDCLLSRVKKQSRKRSSASGMKLGSPISNWKVFKKPPGMSFIILHHGLCKSLSTQQPIIVRFWRPTSKLISMALARMLKRSSTSSSCAPWQGIWQKKM